MEKVKAMLAGIPGNVAEYARKTFKIAVFGVKNNLVLVGILLAGYCVIAPAVFITASFDRTMTPRYIWNVMGVYSIIAPYVGGFLIPAVMFSFVHKRRDRDFYHSMPVRREQYFIGYFGAGLAMFTVPYLLMCVIMGLLSGAVGTCFSYVLHALALYIVIYATVLLAIMFSGSILSSVVTLAFVNTFTVIVLFCSFSLTGKVDTDAYLTLLMPYIYIFTPLSGGVGVYESVIDQGIYGWVLWVQLAIAVVELVLAFIMYKLRRGETTMAVAFPKTRYILQYGAMFLVALFATTVFSNAYRMSYSGTRVINIECVVWTAILVFAAFVVLNMILEQNFRAAFHRMRHLFIFAGAYAVTLSLIIGIVGALPHWVVPIRTDAIIIRYETEVYTFDKPDEDEDYYGIAGYVNEDGKVVAAGYAGDYDYAAAATSIIEVEPNYAGDYEYAETTTDDAWVEPDYADNEYYEDKNGRPLYYINKGMKYYVVTDPAQVKELLNRISDCKNSYSDYWTFYNDIHEEEERVEYYLTMILYTLKPGESVSEIKYLDDMSDISSQSYYVVPALTLPPAGLEHFTNGMDMMELNYRPYDW